MIYLKKLSTAVVLISLAGSSTSFARTSFEEHDEQHLTGLHIVIRIHSPNPTGLDSNTIKDISIKYRYTRNLGNNASDNELISYLLNQTNPGVWEGLEFQKQANIIKISNQYRYTRNSGNNSSDNKLISYLLNQL